MRQSDSNTEPSRKAFTRISDRAEPTSHEDDGGSEEDVCPDTDEPSTSSTDGPEDSEAEGASYTIFLLVEADSPMAEMLGLTVSMGEARFADRQESEL